MSRSVRKHQVSAAASSSPFFASWKSTWEICWIERVLDVHADAAAQLFERLVGNADELALHGVLLRSALRLILPAGVLGSSATNSTWRGYSCLLRRSFMNAWISAAMLGSDSRATMYASPTSPPTRSW